MNKQWRTKITAANILFAIIIDFLRFRIESLSVIIRQRKYEGQHDKQLAFVSLIGYGTDGTRQIISLLCQCINFVINKLHRSNE